MQILRRLHHLIHINSKARADIRWWNSFLPSWNGISIFISPDWNYAESIQFDTDSSGTCGFGAYLDGAWFGGNCPHQCLKSWQSSRWLPETPPPQSYGLFSVHHLQAGIRKYYAFCHKLNLTTLPRNQALHQPFPFLSKKRGVRKDCLWEREVYQSRHAYPS